MMPLHRRPQRMGNAGRGPRGRDPRDRLGFEEAFVASMSPDLAENVTSSMMFLGSVAHATAQIKLGTGTINMPNAHPANVAAQVAMLDHLTRGRLIMGISPGGLMSDAEVFGNFKKDRNAIFLESINMVLAIWKATHRTSCTASTFTSAPRRR